MDSSVTTVKSSFHTTFVVLVFSALVTFFTSFFFTNKKIQTVLKLETAVCVVASIFYFIFIQKVNSESNIDWKGLTDLRYADWFFTTPIMLVSLAYFLSINSDTAVKVGMMSLIVVLNYIMLGFGYLGEVANFSQIWATILGFVPFFVLFYIIYTNYVKNSSVNHWVFGIYIVIWSLYGIVYLLPDEQKNLITNWLDLVAKGVISLGITGYFIARAL
jgi:bacteriorhodopsin